MKEKKKKKLVRVPSPRGNCGEHFCYIFFKNFHMAVQEKKSFSRISCIQSYFLWNRIITQNTLP